MWESSVEDVTAKGRRTLQAEAQASVLTAVVASAMTRTIAMAGSFSWVTVGVSAGVEGAACIMVAAETLMHQDRGALPAALWFLVD